MYPAAVLIVTHCPAPGNFDAPTVHQCSKCRTTICVDFTPPMLLQAKPAHQIYAVCEFCSLLEYWRYQSFNTRTVSYREAMLISVDQERT